jgi:hypothetical protein
MERDRREAQKSLYAFVRHAWPVVEPGTPYRDNWHVKAICLHLEAITNGTIQRLMINMPPGHAKSLIVCVFWPAWMWLRRPVSRAGARCGLRLARVGREDVERTGVEKRFDANSPRRVGPPRVRGFGLRASVDGTSMKPKLSAQANEGYGRQQIPLISIELLGGRWLLLPGLALEAIPGVGVVPIWLLVVVAIALLGTARPNLKWFQRTAGDPTTN